MSSSTLVTTTGISWSELPAGPLTDIANRMDTEFDILHLRAVCKSWRSSLSSHPSEILGSIYPSFPLNLPILSRPEVASTYFISPYRYTLHQTTIYGLSPAWDEDDSVLPWMLRVSESKPRTFSIMFPLTSDKVDRLPPRSINLLNYRITRITHLYDVKTVDVPPDRMSEIRKVVLTEDFFETGDRVLLGLFITGELALWRFGDENWTWITTEWRKTYYYDIVGSRGKFYATSDDKGGLVLIDSSLHPFQLVEDKMHGRHSMKHLVACGSNVFMVDEVYQVEGPTKFSYSLFKLDDKNRFWDSELQMEKDERVIFLGVDGNFSIFMVGV